jgi:hypothetical protein
LTKTDQIAVRVFDRELEHSIGHLLRTPLGRAMVLDRALDGHDIIDVDVLSCGRVRISQVSVPHKHYCNVIASKATPFDTHRNPRIVSYHRRVRDMSLV